MLLEHDIYNSSEGKRGKLIDLSGYIVENFDFGNLDLSGIDARVSIFKQCCFSKCDLFGTHFNDSVLLNANFYGASHQKSEFHGVSTNKTCFDSTNLSEAEFIEARLLNTTFRNADLVGSIIDECDLTNTIKNSADVTGSAISDNQEINTSWLNVKGGRLVRQR